MTQTEFYEKYNDAQLKEIARDIAGSAVERTYDKGNSHDVRRETTAEEKRIIYQIAYSSMLAYGHRKDSNIDSILDLAEYMLIGLAPQFNSYDTIYIPLRKITKTGLWK